MSQEKRTRAPNPFENAECDRVAHVPEDLGSNSANA